MRIKNVSRALLAVSLGMVSATSFAWWGAGHEMIAEIAYANLTSTARAKVDVLLNYKFNWPAVKPDGVPSYLPTPSNLVDHLHDYILANSWADTIKSYTWSNQDENAVYAAMHYINIPMMINFPFKQKTDIANECTKVDWYTETQNTINDVTKGEDVVSASISSIKTLLSKEDTMHKAIALRFLMHYAGDVYMPFHSLEPTFNFKDDDNNAHTIATRGANLIAFPKGLGVKIANYNPDDPAHPKTHESIEEWHAFWDGAVNLYDNLPDPGSNTRWDSWQASGDKYRNYIHTVTGSIVNSFNNDYALNNEIKQKADFVYWAAETATAGCLILTNKHDGNVLLYEITPDPKDNSKYLIEVNFPDNNHYDAYEDKVKALAARQIYIAGMHLAYILNAIFSDSDSRASGIKYGVGAEKAYQAYINAIANSGQVMPLDALVNKILNPPTTSSTPTSPTPSPSPKPAPPAPSHPTHAKEGSTALGIAVVGAAAVGTAADLIFSK